MRAVLRYVAKDDREFANEADCLAHDALVDRVALVMSGLGDRPKGIDNGEGYVLHGPDDVTRAKAGLLVELGHPEIDAAECHPMSWIGRLADDTGGPVGRAWARLCCIDSAGREWGQPYFALHPEKGQLIEVIR